MTHRNSAFADSELCGVSTTGHGESILKIMLARKAASILERTWEKQQQSSSSQSSSAAQSAAEQAVEYMKQRVGGYGGLILIDKNGNVGHAFSTKRMVWAQMTGTGGVM